MWVVDTSALVRLFIPDGPIHPEIEEAFNRALNGADLILAPQLLLVEIANVLMRKKRLGILSGVETQELIRAIRDLPIRYIEHQDIISAACDLSSNFGLSVYDALYLALAERHGAKLMTGDNELEKAAVKLGLA